MLCVIPGWLSVVPAPQQLRIPSQQDCLGSDRPGICVRHDQWTNVEPHQGPTFRPEDSERRSGVHSQIVTGV